MATAAEKWTRLERLHAILATGDSHTTASLCDLLGVSGRTIARDVAELRDQGVLVECDRGRGGGVRLASGQGGGRVRLNQDEAISVLAAMALAEALDFPLRSGTLSATRHKLASAFAPKDRSAIRTLRRRILVGGAASAQVAAQFGPTTARDHRAARQAFVEQRMLELTYQDPAGRQTTRLVEPQYLVLNPPVWYILAWDHLREAVRAFRFDRIRSCKVLGRRFNLRPAAPFLAAVEAGVETL